MCGGNSTENVTHISWRCKYRCLIDKYKMYFWVYLIFDYIYIWITDVIVKLWTLSHSHGSPWVLNNIDWWNPSSIFSYYIVLNIMYKFLQQLDLVWSHVEERNLPTIHTLVVDCRQDLATLEEVVVVIWENLIWNKTVKQTRHERWEVLRTDLQRKVDGRWNNFKLKDIILLPIWHPFPIM